MAPVAQGITERTQVTTKKRRTSERLLDVSDRLVEQVHDGIRLIVREDQRRRQRENVVHIAQDETEILRPLLHLGAHAAERIKLATRGLVAHELDPGKQ